MNEEDFEAGRPQRSKISQGKLKSVQSMSRSTVAVDQNQQHSLRRTATAPPSYTNQPVYMDPNAVYGQPQPMVFQQPAYYPPPAPIYYPPAPPQPTVIIRQNQRVVPQRYNAYSDNNETFEGCFGPDVPHSQLFVNRSPICQQHEQLETFERNRPHQSSRARPVIILI